MPIATELATAVALLTRLPVGRWAAAEPVDAVWAYPLAGAVVGAIGAAVLAGGRAAGMPSALAAIWALAALLLVTGALHEDGLADTADAFGGGRDRARKLDIMRDSRIGSFGSLALLVTTALRIAAVASLPSGVALIAAGALGRAALLLPLLLLSPARADGLGASLRRVPAGRLALAAVLGMAVALATLPAGRAVVAILAAAVTGLAMARLARRQIGGYTGDVLGATSVVAECVVLSLLSLRAG